MKKSLQDKVVLLTGAGSGIGRCLANELAQQGAKLILMDMNEKGLQETVAIYSLQENLLGTIIDNLVQEEAPERVMQQARAFSSRIDILYSNAGMMTMGQAKDFLWEDVAQMQAVNLNAPLKLSLLAIPQMIEQGGGQIIYTCSTAALVTAPGTAAYGMSKAGLLAFSEALRAELYRHNISVTTVCPGFVHTPLVVNTQYKDDRCREKTMSMPSFIGSSPERVARISVAALLKRKGLVVINWDEKLKLWIKIFCSSLYDRLNYAIAKMLLDKK